MHVCDAVNEVCDALRVLHTLHTSVMAVTVAVVNVGVGSS